jgi:hypothetical protein
VGHIAVADAVCYLFGTFGLIVFVSEIAPRLLGIDLKKEALRVEQELGIDRSQPGVSESAVAPCGFSSCASANAIRLTAALARS